MSESALILNLMSALEDLEKNFNAKLSDQQATYDLQVQERDLQEKALLERLDAQQQLLEKHQSEFNYFKKLAEDLKSNWQIAVDDSIKRVNQITIEQDEQSTDLQKLTKTFVELTVQLKNLKIE